jgi:hypothetical protein
MIKLGIPTIMHNGMEVKEIRHVITSTLILEVMIWLKFTGGLQSSQRDVAGKQLLLGMGNSTIRHGNVI